MPIHYHEAAHGVIACDRDLHPVLTANHPRIGAWICKTRGYHKNRLLAFWEYPERIGCETCGIKDK